MFLSLILSARFRVPLCDYHDSNLARHLYESKGFRKVGS